MSTFFTPSDTPVINPSLTVSVSSGFDFLKDVLADSLEYRGVAAKLNHSLHVVFDADWLFALDVPLLPNAVTIIMTDNPCPEYWVDLYKRKPTVLIAGQNFNLQRFLGLVFQADALFATGRTMKKTPYDYESPLSDAEREVFWAVVRGDGLSNAQIANKLKRSVKTVEHHLGEIFFKLNIKNRTQLALFYRHGHIKRD